MKHYFARWEERFRRYNFADIVLHGQPSGKGYASRPFPFATSIVRKINIKNKFADETGQAVLHVEYNKIQLLSSYVGKALARPDFFKLNLSSYIDRYMYLKEVIRRSAYGIKAETMQ